MSLTYSGKGFMYIKKNPERYCFFSTVFTVRKITPLGLIFNLKILTEHYDIIIIISDIYGMFTV